MICSRRNKRLMGRLMSLCTDQIWRIDDFEFNPSDHSELQLKVLKSCNVQLAMCQTIKSQVSKLKFISIYNIRSVVFVCDLYPEKKQSVITVIMKTCFLYMKKTGMVVKCPRHILINRLEGIEAFVTTKINGLCAYV